VKVGIAVNEAARTYRLPRTPKLGAEAWLAGFLKASSDTELAAARINGIGQSFCVQRRLGT
jgi:hypothetical protein